MENVSLLLSMGAAAMILLWVSWVLVYGIRRGSFAILLRFFWTLPIVLMMFPEVLTVQVPSTVSVKPIHVFVDDSSSMKKGEWLGKSEEIISSLKEDCNRLACKVKVSYLSSFFPGNKEDLSRINDALVSWYYDVSTDPWMILSDGGNYKPRAAWSSSLASLASSDGSPRGLIVGFNDDELENIWVQSSEDTMFSFEGKSISLSVDLFRNSSSEDLPVQIQVSSGKKHLATSNVVFRSDEQQIQVDIPLPSLQRGNHFINIEALPTANEAIVWDNKVHRNLEVMPNTIGVLHLLGSPSWDGRFIRRYLKSEPKYDLISFFILRDPVDHQLTNERELSLIPFPVDRLFTQELPNFRSVVLQNFSLYQFLEPNYQENLVKFVKEGGGLLFIGGSRAFSSADYRSSALADILPFETKGGSEASSSPLSLLTPVPMANDRSGPYYDPNLSFTVEPAKPEGESRELANVYDDWLRLIPEFKGDSEFKGLHHMENVKFKEGEYTPLLEAKLSSGKRIPLAVASYPGKGRALWIFSDSFWQIAMNENISRQVYYDFFNSAMTWLLREEFRKPISLQNLELSANESHTKFSFLAHGPASSYLDSAKTWQVTACGYPIQFDKLLINKLGSQSWKIQGSFDKVLQGGTVCNLMLSGEHSSFGSVKTRIGGQVPEVFTDKDVPFSLQSLESLAEITKSQLGFYPKQRTMIDSWLGSVTGNMGVSAPSRNKSFSDYFWVLKTWWVYLLLLCLPFEVLVRRWPELMTIKRSN